MSLLDTVPKNLPKTDPLQWSFLVAIEALNLNVNFNGASDHKLDKPLPAFEYAVNNWREVTPERFSEDGLLLEQDVLCALWRGQPDQNDCKVKWSKMPDGSDLKRQYDMDYLYEFEQWKLNTWNDLRRIIATMLVRNDSKQRDPITKKILQFPADIFQFELVNNQISYIYAKNSTQNKFLGIGATFTIRSALYDCCPAIDRNNYTIERFKELGFIFD